MSSCDQGLLVRGHRAFLSFLLEPYKLSLLPLGLVPSRDDLSMLPSETFCVPVGQTSSPREAQRRHVAHFIACTSGAGSGVSLHL